MKSIVGLTVKTNNGIGKIASYHNEIDNSNDWVIIEYKNSNIHAETMNVGVIIDQFQN